MARWSSRSSGILQQFTAQPQTKFTSDIHCVTTWSRYDNQWEGLATRDLLMACQPRDEARYVVLHSHDGYTTNLTLEDFAAEDALLAHSWSGAPLEPEHGGPVRLVVPHLYFWKSAKWLQSIEFLEQDAPGYWEVRGYHNRGDPVEGAALFRRLTLPTSTSPGEVKKHHGDRPCRLNVSNSRVKAAINSRPRWICPSASPWPMRCSRIASPAARTCWRPSASRWRWPQKASRCCGSTSPASAPAKATLPIPPSRRMSPIWCGPPNHLRETRKAPAILIGHSLGGAAILAAAGQIPDARAVVTIAAPSDPAHVTGLFKDRIEDIRKHGKVEVSLAGRPFHITSGIPRRHRRARPDGACRQPAQGAAGHAFADRRHRRHRQCHAHLRRRQASQEFRLAGRRRPFAGRTGATPPMSPMSSPPGPRATSIPSRRSRWPIYRRGAAHRRGPRNPQQQVPAEPSRSGRITCWPMSRSPPAARTPDPGLMIFCWPASAPAPP